MEGLPTLFGNPGDPVPEVDPEDVKTVWDIWQDTASHSPDGRASVSVTIFRHACKPGADIPAVIYRGMMLQLLLQFAKTELERWTKDGQMDFAVLREIARLPMVWIGVGAMRAGMPFDAEELLRRLSKTE